MNNTGPLVTSNDNICDSSTTDDVESSTVMENGKVVVRKHRKNITYPDIAQCFDMPIRDAAQILGISLTQLKRLCREFNIPRWPYRRLNSIQRRIEVLTIMLERNANSGDDRTIRDTREEMRKLQEEARSIKEDPTIVTKQGLDLDGCTSTTFLVQQTPPSNESTPTVGRYGNLNVYNQDLNGGDGLEDAQSRQRLVVKYPSQVHSNSPTGEIKKRKNPATKGGPKKKKTKKSKKIKTEGQSESDDEDEEDSFDSESGMMNQQQNMQQQQQNVQQQQKFHQQEQHQPPLMMMIDPLYNPNITSSRRRQAPTPQPQGHPMQQMQRISSSPQNTRINPNMGRGQDASSLLSFMNQNNGGNNHGMMHRVISHQQERVPSPPRNITNQPQSYHNRITYPNLPSLQNYSGPLDDQVQQFDNSLNSHANSNGYLPNLPNQLLRFDVASVQQDLETGRRDSADGDILRKFSVSSLFDRRQSSVGDFFASEEIQQNQPSSQSDAMGTILSPMRGSGSISSSNTFEGQQDGDVMRILQQMHYNNGPYNNSGSFFPQGNGQPVTTPENRYHS